MGVEDEYQKESRPLIRSFDEGKGEALFTNVQFFREKINEPFFRQPLDRASESLSMQYLWHEWKEEIPRDKNQLYKRAVVTEHASHHNDTVDAFALALHYLPDVKRIWDRRQKLFDSLLALIIGTLWGIIINLLLGRI